MLIHGDMDALAHIYDPAKRHEYYLRTRVLKGRRKGAGPTPAPRQKSPAEKAAERRKHLQTRIEQLQAKLETLREVVRKLVADAKRRSGSEDPTSNYSKKDSDPTSKYSSKTPSQKAAAAKASAKYYDENSEEILKERADDLVNQIKAIQARIHRLREKD